MGRFDKLGLGVFFIDNSHKQLLWGLEVDNGVTLPTDKLQPKSLFSGVPTTKTAGFPYVAETLGSVVPFSRSNVGESSILAGEVDLHASTTRV